MKESLLIFCREVDVKTGKVCAYPLSIDVDDNLIFKLQMKSHYQK